MNKVQRHRHIRAAMVRRGIKSSDIARELKITRQAVYMIISGRKNSRRIVAALIEAGVPAKLFVGVKAAKAANNSTQEE
jgi:predicted transcriptional regulator